VPAAAAALTMAAGAGPVAGARRPPERPRTRLLDEAGRWVGAWLAGGARRDAIARAGRAGGRIIELGIGTGAMLGALAAGTSHVGVDWRPAALQIAAARAARRGPAGFHGLVRAAPERLPFADGVFDTALASISLAETGDPAAALAELVRVVRARGEIIIVDRFAGDAAAASPGGRAARGAGGAAGGGIAALIGQPGVTMTAVRRLPPFGLFTLICLRVETAPARPPRTARQPGAAATAPGAQKRASRRPRAARREPAGSPRGGPRRRLTR